jgi:hypothetical protein
LTPARRVGLGGPAAVCPADGAHRLVGPTAWTATLLILAASAVISAAVWSWLRERG